VLSLFKLSDSGVIQKERTDWKVEKYDDNDNDDDDDDEDDDDLSFVHRQELYRTQSLGNLILFGPDVRGKRSVESNTKG
jgi:hypothetical protein